jgi:hypothetical protein
VQQFSLLKVYGVTINTKGEKDKYYIKSDEQIESSKKRMNFFKIIQMQRRLYDG